MSKAPPTVASPKILSTFQVRQMLNELKKNHEEKEVKPKIIEEKIQFHSPGTSHSSFNLANEEEEVSESEVTIESRESASEIASGSSSASTTFSFGSHKSTPRKRKLQRKNESLTTQVTFKKPQAVCSRNSFQSASDLKYKEYRTKAMKQTIDMAADHSKVFMLHTLPNKTLQQALVDRGWIQKFTPMQYLETSEWSDGKMISAKCLDTQISNDILKKVPANFIWSNKYFDQSTRTYLPYYSRLQKRPIEFDFACKVGLAKLSEQHQWLHEEAGDENACCIFPRMYNVCNGAELSYFIADFRLTICTSFLYYLYQQIKKDMDQVFSRTTGKSTDCIMFALEQAEAAIRVKQHCDLDHAPPSSRLDSRVYCTYFETYSKIMKYQTKLRLPDDKEPEMFRDLINHSVTQLLKYYPDIPIDGVGNVWILKPTGGRCGCGFGISLSSSEPEILKRISNKKYLLQKYIEKPMLVHNTKFDLRQYILLNMRDDCLFVWVYKNCYLKFSTQEYTLDSLSPAIHVTNHTVQKKLKIGKRSDKLPETNMWSLDEFLVYLSQTGRKHLWTDKIFPGICAAIKKVIHSALEGLEYVEKNFQLFGADIMITEDNVPVLLEVNSSPDLTHSTPITKIICTEVVEDMVKGISQIPSIPVIKYLIPFSSTVVIDRRRQTGDFEQIMQIDLTPPRDPKTNLIVYGRNCAIEPCGGMIFKTTNNWNNTEGP